MTVLLDTPALVWWLLEPKRLSPRQRRVLSAARSEAPVLLSDISLWEIATLATLGRVEFDIPLRDWLERATAPPLVQTLRITPAVAAEVQALPDSFHRDPADRLIVATARVHAAAVMTRDRRIIDAGIVPVVI